MKKKLFIIFLISLFLLTGCKNKQEESLKKQEDLVKEDLKELSNISIEKIRNNYNCLKNNYNKISDSTTFERVAYSTKYLQALGVYEEDNDLEILADNATKYLKNQNKTTLEELKKSLSKVDGKEEDLFDEIYTSFMKNEIVGKLIDAKRDLVEADLNDRNVPTVENLNIYYSYIENHIYKPFKNNETIEYLVYYSLYFKESNTDNKLATLGTKSLDYLRTLDNQTLNEIHTLINEINKNKNGIINDFIKQVR
jgi:uncharacterized protein YcfL